MELTFWNQKKRKRKPSNNTTQVTETYPEYQEHSNGHHRNLEPELSGIDEEQTFIFAKDVTDSETRDKDDWTNFVFILFP